jgi:hypothetical protein
MIQQGWPSSGSLTPVTNGVGAGSVPLATTPRLVVARVTSYVTLTKPRIIELLLVTTVPTMFVAARHVPFTPPDGPDRGRRERWPPAEPTP